MRASPAFELGEDGTGKDLLMNEMTRISRFPFEADKWLAAGHTINTTDRFREKFGYSHFLFAPLGETRIKGLGRVCFLLLVSLYEDEFEHLVRLSDGSFHFLEAYYASPGDKTNELGWIDRKRERIFPDD